MGLKITFYFLSSFEVKKSTILLLAEIINFLFLFESQSIPINNFAELIISNNFKAHFFNSSFLKFEKYSFSKSDNRIADWARYIN